ncbi:scaffold attachment factor B2-like isoform X2 [Ornithodoros turicata]|uniref:scaffold attachment factor B2-like isoform X2 n=1 Tax=Ornithodoros turicata TaxID=34597 RepID=UPI00313A27E1
MHKLILKRNSGECSVMASAEDSSVPKKTLSDLKVVELRNELEKRGLEKTGCKATLVERLSKVLEEDGEDPETYEFELTADSTPSKANSNVVEENSGGQGSVEEMEEAEEEEEKDESIDPDALQLSIEDEEKLLNEEEETYEKARDDTQVEDTTAKDVSETSVPGEEKSSAVEEGTGDNVDTSVKKEGDVREDSPAKKAKRFVPSSNVIASCRSHVRNGAAATPGKDAAKPAGKLAKDGSKRVVASPSSGRNVWVSGLSSSTRAADLKALFSKHGKVVAAKIVTNARTPGARCYGFITMGTLDQATKCIQHLHRTELHGKMISVERTKQEPGAALKRSEAKTNLALKAKAAAEATATPAASTETKSEGATAKPVSVKKKTTLASAAAVPKKKAAVKATGKQKTSAVKKVVKKDVISEDDLVVIDEKTDKDDAAKDKPREKRAPRDRSRERSRDRRPHIRSRERPPFVRRRFSRPFHDRGMVRGSRFFRRAPFLRRAATTPFFRGRGGFRSSFGMQPRPSLTDTLTFRKIKEEHMRTREREEERRSFQESLRQKELERRQREEAFRLEREREHLRIEREKLEREKLEVIRLEREKQRLERERIQREREDLRQRQLMAGRVEERAEPARRMKRPVAPERREDDAYWAEKKRSHSRTDYPSSAAVPAKLPPPPPPQQSRSADRLDHHFSSSHHHSSHHSSHHRHHTTSPANIPSASGSMFPSSGRPADYRSGPPVGAAPPSASRRSGPPVRSEWRQASDSAPPRREHRFSDSDVGKAYGGSSSSSRGFPSSWSKPSFSSSQSWDARKDSAWNGSADDGRWRTGGSGSGGGGYGSGGVSNGSLGSHGGSGSFGERFSSSSRRY